MLTVISLASSAVLAAGATAMTVPEPPEPPKKERVICRTQEKMGSRLGGKRVCNTKARWAEIERDSMSAVRDFQQQRGSNPTNGN